MKKFYPIGHVFEDKGVRLKVVECPDVKNKRCIDNGCYYAELPPKECFDRACECLRSCRPDKKNVVFVRTIEPLTK